MIYSVAIGSPASLSVGRSAWLSPTVALMFSDLSAWLTNTHLWHVCQNSTGSCHSFFGFTILFNDIPPFITPFLGCSVMLSAYCYLRKKKNMFGVFIDLAFQLARGAYRPCHAYKEIL